MLETFFDTGPSALKFVPPPEQSFLLGDASGDHRHTVGLASKSISLIIRMRKTLFKGLREVPSRRKFGDKGICVLGRVNLIEPGPADKIHPWSRRCRVCDKIGLGRDLTLKLLGPKLGLQVVNLDSDCRQIMVGSGEVLFQPGHRAGRLDNRFIKRHRETDKLVNRSRPVRKSSQVAQQCSLFFLAFVEADCQRRLGITKLQTAVDHSSQRFDVEIGADRIQVCVQFLESGVLRGNVMAEAFEVRVEGSLSAPQLADHLGLVSP